MPNWCNNEMTICHSDPAMIQKAADAWNAGEFLQTLIPTPPELLDTVKGWTNDEEKQKANDAKIADNMKNHGYATWWDYRVAEWGTKWDVGLDSNNGEPVEVIDGGFYVFFESAWSPPCEAYAKLEKMGFEITAYYAETGCDFCGKWQNGQDECYKISKGGLPNDIVEAMCLDMLETGE